MGLCPTSKLDIGICVVYLLLIQVFAVNCEEKSLFDDLPFNGAYIPDETAGLNIKHVKSSQRPLEIKHAVKNSKESKDPAPLPVRDKNPEDLAEGNPVSHENSLFNQLPDLGALRSDEQPSQSQSISSTQKRSFEHSKNSNSESNSGRSFGAVKNYFTSFFDPGRTQTPKATATPTPVTFHVHSPPGASTIITSSGVRLPLTVQSRENETNVFDANVSPQHQQFAIPVLTQQLSTPGKGDPAPAPGPVPVRHVYSTSQYSPPDNKYLSYDESHHYFPSRTKVQTYPIPDRQFVHAKPADIVYGTYARYESQQPTPGYIYNPPTTTTTTTTPAPVPPPTSRPRPPPTHLPIPVVIGPSNPANPAANELPEYDYDTLEDKPSIHGQFGARTGSFTMSIDGGVGITHSRSGARYNDAHAPSYTYSSSAGWSEPEQLKPVLIPPPPSYGPPAAPSYGPPPEVHPPAPPPQQSPPAAPAPPPATATTSISYHTIPIQTIQTQLVTVPHITVSSSSVIENEVSQDTPAQRPQRPANPSPGGYGWSAYDAQETGAGNAQVSKKSGSVFTDDQIASLLAFNHGLGGSSVGAYASASREIDALALLTGQSQAQGGRGVGIQGLGAGLGQLGLPLDDSLQGLGLGVGSLGAGDSFQQLQLQAPFPNVPNLGRSRVPLRQRPLVSPVHPLRLNGLRNNVNNVNNGLYKRNVAEILTRQRYADNFGTLPNQGLLLDANRYGTGAGGTILTKDAIQAVNDLVQEQRLRGAVNDLRTRLEYEGRSAARARENYRSLFYKGALLLSALTLIPTLASPIASATVAQQAIANAAGPLGHLLPLASGRRKRDTDSNDKDSIRSLSSSNSLEDCTPILRNSSFGSWLNCAENATMELFQNTTEQEADSDLNPTDSLFDSLAFNGALVPESIRANLVKYLPAEEIRRNSECIQKRFCETLKQIEELPNAESILFIYSIFAGDTNSNPWIREAMTGGRNNNCGAFYCSDDYQHSDWKRKD